MKQPAIANPFATSLHACRAAVRYVLLFGLLSNLLMLALPIYSLQVLDRVLSSSSADTLLMLTVIVTGALLALSMLQTARARVSQKVAEWLERRLAPQLFAGAVSQAAKTRSVGASQGLRDLTLIRQFVGGPAFAALMDAPWSLIFVAMLFMLHPTIGLIALIGAVTLLAIALVEEGAVKPAMEESGKASLKGFHQLDMASRNAEAVEAMGMLPNLLKRWQHDQERAITLSAEAQHRATRLSSLSRFVRFSLQVVVIGVSAWLVLHNEMTAGAIIAASILVGRALAPMETVISGWSQLTAVREAYRRLQKTFAHMPPSREEEIELPAPQGKLEAHQLIYVPPGLRKPTLKNVTFTLQPGQALGIIGPSGAGKSTLVKLMTGVWHPISGSIRLDGAEIHRWKRTQFGRHVGYLPQDVELFYGTVKHNIARMDVDAPDEAVILAAQMAGVHELILKLPQGYETEIGIDGTILSGGQRQRIALARALYGNPSLLVLDEPNTSLDSEGEQALMNAIYAAKQRGVTVVMVSHRPSLMQLADYMMMLKDGEIASFGTRDDLFARLKVPQRHGEEA